jgi:hypothetical protein
MVGIEEPPRHSEDKFKLRIGFQAPQLYFALLLSAVTANLAAHDVPLFGPEARYSFPGFKYNGL